MTSNPRYILAAAGIGVLIAAIGVRVVWNDSPARGAADRAAVYASQQKPSLPARTRPVERAPKVGEIIPGDGTWLIGRQIKRGTYKTAGSSICLWQRLVGGAAGWVVVDGAFEPGPQVVVLGKGDVAFASQGCGPWVMVS